MGRGAGDLGVLLGLAQDLGHHPGEAVQRLLGLSLGGLDQQRLLDQEREVDGGRMNPEVEQSLGRKPLTSRWWCAPALFTASRAEVVESPDVALTSRRWSADAQEHGPWRHSGFQLSTGNFAS